MKTYVFRVMVEPDEGKWHATLPDLETRGASLWDGTRDEALKNIRELARMTTEDMLDDGEPIPPGVMAHDEPLISVTV